MGRLWIRGNYELYRVMDVYVIEWSNWRGQIISYDVEHWWQIPRAAWRVWKEVKVRDVDLYYHGERRHK